jgi:hypothetical protein
MWLKMTIKKAIRVIKFGATHYGVNFKRNYAKGDQRY